MEDTPHARADGLLEGFRRRWRLAADGEAFHTHASVLQPVRWEGQPAMLKLALHEEERRGAALMEAWEGAGAARVLARAGPALLLERATGPASLARMARSGRDDEASDLLCAVTARLHDRRPTTPALTPLREWFAPLLTADARDRAPLGAAATAAARLLAAPRDPVALHGDLHHDNVLDFGERGWLAIDPKGLVGDRAFDYVNPFRNPDTQTALAPGRFERRLERVAAAAGLERDRLANWILAFAGLSAVWILVDGGDPADDLAVAERARAALEGR